MGNKKNINTKIPVMFQKIKTFEEEDTRFLKVRIWLMHLEENLNGSYFDKSVVESAIESLANTPILAYIEDNSSGEKDFSDHRMVLVKDENGYEIKYIGQAIGLIPETNNATFETRLCDDGIEREFLVCDGIVWQKWDDPIDIFERDGIKPQSMELHDDYEGEFKDDGLFHFTKFKFFGACALGSDVLPAMRSATIEPQFSFEKVHEEIQMKMEQFKSIAFESNKGGKLMDEKLELLKKYSLIEETLKENEINLEDYSIEELEVKFQELVKTDDKTDFSFTASQLRDEIRGELYTQYEEDEWGYKSRKYWYVDHDDSKVIAEDSKDNYRLVGIPFSVDGDKVTLDFEGKKKVKVAYEFVEGETELEFELTSKDKVEYQLQVKEKEIEKEFTVEKENAIKAIQSDLDTLTEQYSTLEKEKEELSNFKSNKLQEERNQAEVELFERFSNELNEVEIKEVKEQASKFTIQELEEKLFTLVGKKKAKFSATKKQEDVKIGLEKYNVDKENTPYGDLFDKFNK